MPSLELHPTIGAMRYTLRGLYRDLDTQAKKAVQLRREGFQVRRSTSPRPQAIPSSRWRRGTTSSRPCGPASLTGTQRTGRPPAWRWRRSARSRATPRGPTGTSAGTRDWTSSGSARPSGGSSGTAPTWRWPRASCPPSSSDIPSRMPTTAPRSPWSGSTCPVAACRGPRTPCAEGARIASGGTPGRSYARASTCSSSSATPDCSA